MSVDHVCTQSDDHVFTHGPLYVAFSRVQIVNQSLLQ